MSTTEPPPGPVDSWDASPPPLPSRLPLVESIRRHVRYTIGKRWAYATAEDLFRAVALAVRETLIERGLATEARYAAAQPKRLYYLSMEFLVGRSLGNNLRNLGLHDEVREALASLGHDLNDVLEAERDAALGNGGLGRLAACFLDSLATHDLPGYGYGIDYEFGLFRQVIRDGAQKERPDHWRGHGSPWLVERRESAILVPAFGRIVQGRDRKGRDRSVWIDRESIVGVAHDLPIVGYGGNTVNFLRLFRAKSSEDFDMEIFNSGDYVRAIEGQVRSERLSKVLYPSDDAEAGRELRLLQEWFLVACAVADILRRHEAFAGDLESLPDRVAIQLNDTHPALAVTELMRRLVDDRQVPWEKAWDATRRVLAFTNHTLLPEALETWPADLFARVLPRHLQILYEINHRFLEIVAARWPGDGGRRERMSIVGEGEPKRLRMAHLAIVGSHAVNGVAELHSRLLRETVFRDFHELWPERFHNQTNGVTPRRWIQQANPWLAALLAERLGPRWVVDLERLREIEPLAEDPGFREAFRAAKQSTKERLAAFLRRETRQDVDPGSLFDIQAKRLHLYKRQLLHLLAVIDTYLALADDGVPPPHPRTHVFAGKAAPGYRDAKTVLRLIHAVARTVNADPRARDWLRVVFVPDYRVSVAEILIPAADLSEQISTAGMEASGTGNMKFALNGALTIGTRDGATIEIAERAGEDNVFLFGLSADEVAVLKTTGAYCPAAIVARSPRVARIVASIGEGRFPALGTAAGSGEGGFEEVRGWLLDPADPFVHLADLESYLQARERASRAWADPDGWTRAAIRNVARLGFFSSDRTVRGYASAIWGLRAVP